MTALSAIVIQENAPAGPALLEDQGTSWSGPEKRRARRYPTCDPVEVFLLDFARVRMSGVLRDVSRDGFRVEIDLPVQRGARLKLRLRNQTTVFAVARYCRRTGDSYQVGAEIEWLYCANNQTAPAAPGESCKLASAIVDFHMFPWIQIVNGTRSRLPAAADQDEIPSSEVL